MHHFFFFSIAPLLFIYIDFYFNFYCPCDSDWQHGNSLIALPRGSLGSEESGSEAGRGEW